MQIYKHYTQKQLDHQYNKRADVPDFSKYVEKWHADSKQLRDHPNGTLNIQYGEQDRETLDIFQSNAANSPVHVFFHGGYWQAMDKSVFHFIAAGFLPHNITTVLVNYPLAPHASISQIVQSCQNAMIWLYDNIARYSGDPKKIFAAGHSAGGQIVGMLLATHWKQFSTRLPVNLVKGGCAISGLFNLIPIQKTYLNAVLGMDPAEAHRNSPQFLQPVNGSPLIVSLGDLESEEFHAQSAAFAQSWASENVPISEIAPEGHNHFSILDELANSDGVLNRMVRAQMGLLV